jgi:23S rRNA pseudouridine1911/1915/1917 synthase
VKTILTVPVSAAGRRLDQFLRDEMPEYSRARLQGWVKEGRVKVNGELARASLVLRGGEAIEVEPAALRPLRAVAEDLPVRVLYEDSDVIAVDKPAGMTVHAGAGIHSGTLVNALLHRYGKLAETGEPLRPGIVHRLDRLTSGVLVVARTERAHRALARQFAGREVEKVYVALVRGELNEERGEIRLPITRDPAHRTRMTARLGRGREAVTWWRRLRRYKGFTLVEVRIGTGRTHQIRAHFAAAGHPVAGDRLYGAAGHDSGRFFLHARRIRFASPATGAPVEVTAPVPEELEGWLKELEAL